VFNLDGMTTLRLKLSPDLAWRHPMLIRSSKSALLPAASPTRMAFKTKKASNPC
jgi:hypothetical protein